MDWIIILALCALTFFSVGEMMRLKKEVASFANRIERNLDHVIAGEEIEEVDETADTLWGKVGERFQRVDHIWKRKEKESSMEKERIKELISDLSHQTRTPIANIKIYAEFLHGESLSEEGCEFLSNLEEQTEKLDFFLQSMIKISRLETGIIQIQMQEANFYETLRGAVAAVVPKVADKRLKLSVECEEALLLVHDMKWTQEAIFNVLDNAAKYTNSGGNIWIVVKRQEMFTRVSIKDSGKGIARERQAEIFTRFYREPEVREQPGVGIGLYLTRKILELQGGYIEVHSEVDEGTEFRLYLREQSS
ncbi:MAG: HAMP domain-containing histidine kinase [Lachnospiraceae bacterium]|nr:HAMP domain-containing histidine kinase [Lachnospiraceae bacterium]